jgi:uncharacterized DUF497 family protein
MEEFHSKLTSFAEVPDALQQYKEERKATVTRIKDVSHHNITYQENRFLNTIHSMRESALHGMMHYVMSIPMSYKNCATSENARK